MTSYRAQYVVNYRANLLRPEPLEEPIRLECDFAFDGPKAFYEKAVFQNDELALRETEGFDGEALRGLLREPGHSPHGYIMTLDSRSRKRFYGFGNPFLAAGLLNGPIDWGRDVQGMDDLAEQMRTSLIFETPVEIDGIECLAFGCFQEMYFCAPELGYAFIELRSGKYRLDKATGAYEKSDSCLVQKNSDFVEVIDGLQLPQTIEHIHMRDGEVFVDFTTTVQKYEVNEEIPDELFTDIIPNGVHVIDGILGFGYVQDSSKKNEGIGEQ